MPELQIFRNIAYYFARCGKRIIGNPAITKYLYTSVFPEERCMVPTTATRTPVDTWETITGHWPPHWQLAQGHVLAAVEVGHHGHQLGGQCGHPEPVIMFTQTGTSTALQSGVAIWDS